MYCALVGEDNRRIARTLNVNDNSELLVFGCSFGDCDAFLPLMTARTRLLHRGWCDAHKGILCVVRDVVDGITCITADDVPDPHPNVDGEAATALRLLVVSGDRGPFDERRSAIALKLPPVDDEDDSLPMIPLMGVRFERWLDAFGRLPRHVLLCERLWPRCMGLYIGQTVCVCVRSIDQRGRYHSCLCFTLCRRSTGTGVPFFLCLCL